VSNFFRNVAAGIATALFAVGCYSPNINPGSYTCGSDGGCPDKFHCAANNRCYPEGAALDMAPACNSDASAVQVCSAPHASGQTCNPGCQTGCDGCGWCAVVNGATKCLTGKPGTKDVGSVCSPSLESDCLPGLYCQPECGTGRCYRICDSSDKSVCGTGSMCNLAANSRGDAGTFSFSLCSIVSTCDAVAQTGCPTAFACFPTIPTECDCPGSMANGQACQLAAQCGRGSSCIGLSASMSLCLQTCRTTADCTAGTCKNANPYGYCM
jgi:hypothetical protein